MTEYWTALKAQNADVLDRILRISPELVHSAINSNPWKLEIDDSYPYETRGVHFCSFSGREQLLQILLKHGPDLEMATFEENKG